MKLSGLVLSLVMLVPGLLAQANPQHGFNSGCSALERKAILQPTDPAYSYAIDLARLLASKGIRMECLCASKSQRMFHGQVGAAYFRTRYGVFEALFLPKGQVFRVEMTEKPEGDHYIYTFGGNPSGHSVYSSRPMAIIQKTNVLVTVYGDRQLAARLEKALESRLARAATGHSAAPRRALHHQNHHENHDDQHHSAELYEK